MKTIKIYKLLVLLFVASVFMFCSKNDEGDTVPPGKLTVTSVIPTNGGAKIEYTLPSDTDILYVKAEYINPKGEKVFRVSSATKNSIEIDGFLETTPQSVNLFVIDESENHSLAEEVIVEPLKSFIYLVQESISMEADLGGIKMNWENIASKTVYVYLYYNDGSKEVERILSSNKLNESIFIRGLQAIPYDFYVVVEDFNGNKTGRIFVDNLTPKFEEEIDKSTWTLVEQLSVDGNAWEGRTTKLFDNVIDTQSTDNDNSYFIIWRDRNGGVLNWPLDIVIDLNKQVKVNRLKVWQRAFWYGGPAGKPYYYQSENMKSFDVFVSNDKQTWNLVGKFDIGDPKDGNGEISSEKLDEAAAGHDFSFESTTEPFRYLKFSITSNYGSDTYVHGSEITLYGLDNI